MAAEKIKIILVDDHEIFRNGLNSLLNSLGNVKVIAEATNGNEFLEIVEKKKPDIVFMDINMPILDGIDTTETALKKFPNLKIIALSTFGDNEYFNKMLNAGVRGYMLKSSRKNEFIDALECVHTNDDYYYSNELLLNYSKNIINKQVEIIEKDKLPELSRREIEILELVCRGKSNDEIAESLFISKRTVENHKTSLIQKTDTGNTVNLVIYAFKNRMVDL